MSTRLLLVPGKIHELCDDLESLWFVFLYEGLHFVEQDDLIDMDMENLFDSVRVSPKTGTHTGGMGKRDLYSYGEVLMTETLQFKSQPFTALVGKIYWLFHALNAHYKQLDFRKGIDDSTMDTCQKLKSCAEIKRLLREALDSEEWPESCDKVEDQYPPTKHLTPKEKDTIALSYVNCSLIASGEPSTSGTKRKRDEVGEEESPPPIVNKRQKVQPLWERVRSRFKGFWR